MRIDPRCLPNCCTIIAHTYRSCVLCTHRRLVLEDEGARLALCGDALPVGECVTGVVAAVRGHVLANGDLQVSGICYAGMAPQPPLPPQGEDRWACSCWSPVTAVALPFSLCVS
jgi:hypothetical protein